MSGRTPYRTQEPAASACDAATAAFQALIATLPTPTPQESYLMLSGQCLARTYLSAGGVNRDFLSPIS